MDVREKITYICPMKLNLFLCLLIGLVLLSGCVSRGRPREQMVQASPTPRPSATPRSSATTDPFRPLLSGEAEKKP